jgi:UDP-GlcNAc:undecaprenyl-phosphate/decaprenyl-phosphate GlcNAc-1-phosphate transferase
MIFFYSILTFSWALFVSLFAIPSIIQVAHKKQILDIPNNRRQHLSDTPRLGGLAIFAGFISSILLFGEFDNSIQKLIAATIIIFFIGLKDDMVSVSAFKKFFVQILAASIFRRYKNRQLSGCFEHLRYSRRCKLFVFFNSSFGNYKRF